MGLDFAILEEANIKLEPKRTYDVEVELSEGGNPTRSRLYSNQSFKANRPGVFEFIRTEDGVLRQKTRPLRRKRDVYCLVAPGFSIVPGSGMTLINKETISGNYSIQIFEMDQMGCAEVHDQNGAKGSKSP